VHHPGEQIDGAGQTAARVPKDPLHLGVGIGHELGDQREGLCRASEVVQNPPRRHAEGGGTIGGDQERQVAIGRRGHCDAPTYIGLANAPTAQNQGALMIARPEPRARLLLLLPEGVAPSALRDHLCADGHEVSVARSTTEALELLTRMKFGGLVADASFGEDHLPGFVTECLQREASLAIVISGPGHDARSAVRCLRAGAMDYVSDVLDSYAVERAVVEAIARRREVLQEQATKRILCEEVASLTGEVRQERARVESLALATLESLVRVVETKDPWLAGHSVRVAQLAASLAAEMRRNDPEVEAVRLAGRLHDIGMICLGDGILSKEGPLTSTEFDQVKRHVLIGHQILEPLPHLGLVSVFVRSHHERWDGTGYPDGLTAEEIPWGARLIGATEIYDALTTARPYRQRVSPEEAVESMRTLTGKMICPVVFSALADVVSRREALVFVDPHHESERRATGQELVVEFGGRAAKSA
jgi:cyclic di-GMP phosphodiesterase